MKYYKRLFAITLVAVLVFPLMLVACKNNDLTYTPTGNNSILETKQDNGSKTTPEVGNEARDDYLEAYNDLIAEWQVTLNRHINDGYTENDTFDFGFYQGYTDSLKTYYALYDIDGNGIVELLLKKQYNYEDIIAYIFTTKNDEPINLFGYDDRGIPIEVPWSRVGSSKILDNGMIDCYNGDYTIYKIAEDGYSVVKFASAQPYDYPDEASNAEAKWKFYINEIEVDYDFYIQCLGEQGYMVNRDNNLANLDWKSAD